MLLIFQVSSGFFKIYTSNDILGVEIAGALKNVLAIGAGIIEGSGGGFNTKAALVTRGTKVIFQDFLTCQFFKNKNIYNNQEMNKFAKAYGKIDPRTFSGLAGAGDLMLTSFGHLSRNRTFGFRIA